MFDERRGGAGGDAVVLADLRRRLDAMEGGARSRTSGAEAAGRTGGGVGDDAILAAPAPLGAVLPHGGLARGSVVSLSSAAPGHHGVTSLLLALLAAPRGMWIAVVGMPSIGLVAAAEMGVDLARLGLIPDPGPDEARVLSVLADGVDVIAAPPPRRLAPARQRVLSGRLRQSGSVLLVAGRWPGADVAFAVQDVRWSGADRGYGRLRDRELDVRVAGRRAGSFTGAVVTLRLRAARDRVVAEAAGDGPMVRRPADLARTAVGAGAS